MKKRNILVFASDSATGDESDVQELVEFSRTEPPVLDARIAGVISDSANGEVAQLAKNLYVDFLLLSDRHTAENYRALVRAFSADFVMLSGWRQPVRGLDPQRTISIHSGPVPALDGSGFHGHHDHEAVISAFRRGEIKQSAVTMHFVDEVAAVITQLPVLIKSKDTAATLAVRVKEKKRLLQGFILNDVVNGRIRLDGGKVHYPVDYPFRFLGVQ